MWQAREAGTLHVNNKIIQPISVFGSYAGPPIFFLYFISFVYPIVFNKPALIINNHGITDYSSSFIGFGTIYWNEILSIKLHTTQKNTKELYFYLKNPKKILKRNNFIKRRIMAGLFDFKIGVLGIQIVNLDISPDELLSRVQLFYSNKIE